MLICADVKTSAETYRPEGSDETSRMRHLHMRLKMAVSRTALAFNTQSNFGLLIMAKNSSF